MMSTLPLYAFVFLLLRISRGEECTTVHTGRSYLNETFSNSQVLLSGTVDKITLVSNTQDVVQRLNVRIRRIFKGQGYLKSRSFVEVDVPSRYKFCISVLLVHDTRVFALSVNGHTFTLSSAVLPVNLSRKRRGWTREYEGRGRIAGVILLEKPHKKRRKAKPSRCESQLCPLGSKCVFSTGKCECRSHCRSTGPPVCGSDRVSYASACHLFVRACLLAKKGILLRMVGEDACRKRSPCEDLRCGPGEDCVVTQKDGVLSAQCLCPTSCPSYGDSVESSPVCSSQGVDYPSLCHLKQHACLTQTNITVRYFGECDPCSGVDCARGTRCKLSSTRRPECRCSEQCSLNFEPVCATNGLTMESHTITSAKCNVPLAWRRLILPFGIREYAVCASDGRTYPNECKMRKTACDSGTALFVKYDGICEGCEKKNCQYYSTCINENGKAECKCPSECYRNTSSECRGGSCVCSYQCPLSPPNTARVCGEDGVLYASDCHRQLAACEKGSPIPQMPLTHCHSAVAAVDACGCSVFGSSRTDCEQSTGRCECSREARGRKCDQCAPDLVMTASGCVRKEEYRTPGRVVLSCSSMECHHGAKCVESAGGHPDCECPVHCDMEHLGLVANMSVCGSDGTTYENMCHLQQFACKHQLDLVPSSLGICSDGKISDGACKAGDEDCNCSINGEKQHGGQCRPDRGSILNLEMDGEQAYNIDHPNLNLHMNISVKLVPHSSNGAILYARGGQNVLVLRMEMRRIVAE
ncbi:unnamed protein product [Nippostrongylus brasiliensis]|uniref:AGRin (Synaptic protein) homolog family member (inferred by orthology to a C. elegans protein) n=1 Tax=Nippostrongylus brasiliensis TaxID=27835 RepID=A0A158R160_NIPBR|nr:unnamed protein product [Nippostrongylus brasiliensis]